MLTSHLSKKSRRTKKKPVLTVDTLVNLREDAVMSEQKKKLVAYHEAGHAILGALMPLGRVSETWRFARLVKNEGSPKCGVHHKHLVA